MLDKPDRIRPGRKLLSTASPLVALGTFIVMVLTGLLVPLYTDEIGWRFQERAGIDGVDIMFNDMCGRNTIAATPWFLVPVRTFSAIANQALADPLFVRMEGMVCALAWAGLLWLLTARLESDGAARARLRTVLFSLLSLGILPFILVLSRPEQPVILMLMLAMLTALIRPAGGTSAWVTTAKAAAIVLFGWIALSYHLKGVVYSPVFFACLAVCASGRGTLAPRIAGGGALAALTLFSAQYWKHRFQCPDSPVLADILNHENVSSVLANGGSWSILGTALAGGVNPLNYLRLSVPSYYNSYWLPGPSWSEHESILFSVVIFTLWTALLVCALIELVRFLRRERLRALHEPRALIALALLGSLFAWGASQLNRNFYESSHYLPMLLVFCAFCVTLPAEPGPLRQRSTELLSRYGVLFAVLSVAVVVGLSLGPMLRSSSSRGWIAELRVSVSTFGYDQVRQDIAMAMNRAGMGGDRKFNRLLVDDVTYLALQRHTLPLHRLGVLGDWRGAIIDPVAFLRSRNSDGVVMGCRYLPPSMRTVAGRAGEVCAISRQGLDQLAARGPTDFDHGEQF